MKQISEDAIDFEKGGVLTRTFSTFSNFERTEESQDKRSLHQQLSLLMRNVCSPCSKLRKQYLAMALLCFTILLTAAIVIPITVISTETSAPKPIREAFNLFNSYGRYCIAII